MFYLAVTNMTPPPPLSFLFFVILGLCLTQLSQDEATTFYDELNHHIFELVSSSDVNEKKGGILAIGK